MNQAPVGLAQVIRGVAAEERAALVAHPTPEALAAYHEGRLDDASAGVVQEHLAICRLCAGLLLELDAFAANRPPVEAPEDDAELVLPRRAPRPHVEVRDRPVRPGVLAAAWRRRVLPYASAAASALLALGAVGWTFQQAGRPRVNVALAQLAPVDAMQRDLPQGWRVVHLAAEQQYALLLLRAANATPGVAYEARLFDAGAAAGAPLWLDSSLRLGGEGFFTVELPRRLLTRKYYRLHVAGPGLGRAEYPFAVVHD